MLSSSTFPSRISRRRSGARRWLWLRSRATTSFCVKLPARTDAYSIRLESVDFAAGGLNQSSRIRPNRLFTADSEIIVYRAGHISSAKLDETVDKQVTILRQG